jgi:predicted MFS family arabinose efflux permease
VLGGGPLLAAGGLPFLLGIQAAAAVVAAGLVLATLRIPAAYPDDPSAAVTLRWLAHDRFMWLLASLVFIGMGTYNAVATWLQPILAHYGEGDAAGEMVALLTFGGIIGAALIPSAVARADRRRDLLLAAVAISTVAFAALELNQALVWVGAWLFAAGVVLLASLPVVLEWSEVHSGPERQGAAVGFLLMAGNLGGLLLVLLVQVVIGSPSLALGAIAVASAAGIPLALRLPARTRPAAAGGRP